MSESASAGTGTGTGGGTGGGTGTTGGGAAADTAPAAPAVTLPDELVPQANVVEPAPVAAAAPTAVVETIPEAEEIEEIEEDPVPLGVLDDEEEGGLEEIEEEDVPLAAMEAVSGLQHTFQHVCELVASGILPFFLLGSNRKKKKELSELKDQVEGKTGRKEN